MLTDFYKVFAVLNYLGWIPADSRLPFFDAF